MLRSFFFYFASALHGQEAPTITIRKGETINVGLQTLGGSEGAASTKVLQNDLDLSGWFSLYAAPERASYIISGSSAGGTLQGQVTDQRGSVVLQKIVLWWPPPGGTSICR